MKFIVDNQLPVALAEYLRDRGLDCQHVIEEGLGDAADRVICRHAELQDRLIIRTAEEDPPFQEPNPKRWGTREKGKVKIVAGP